MGPMALLPLRNMACCEILSPLKIYRPRPGLYPRTSGPIARTLISRLPRTTCMDILLSSNVTTASAASCVFTAVAKQKHGEETLALKLKHLPTGTFSTGARIRPPKAETITLVMNKWIALRVGLYYVFSFITLIWNTQKFSRNKGFKIPQRPEVSTDINATMHLLWSKLIYIGLK
jgi:hypothetical protein